MFAGDEWLRPVLADDVLLQQMYGFDSDDNSDESGDDNDRAASRKKSEPTIESLQRELARVTATFAAYRYAGNSVYGLFSLNDT